MTDPNAPTKISMKGKPVFDWVAASRSGPMQNKTVKSIAKPNIPLNRIENQIVKGMVFGAL